MRLIVYSLIQSSSRIRTLRQPMLVAMLAAGASACSREAEPTNGMTFSTRDSSGVQIAEIQGDPWDAPTWAMLDSAAAVRIVPNEAVPQTLFGRVRGVLRLTDGTIAVLDIGKHQVHLFDARGAFLRSLGRQGQGPAELATPWRLLRAPADTLGVYDMEGRIELFASDASGSRRLRVPTNREGGAAQILGSFPSGGYVALVNEFAGTLRPGRNSLFSTFHVLSPDGTVGPALARYASAQFTYREDGNGRLRQVEDLFWAEPGMAVLPSGFVWCLATEFNCQIRTMGGAHLRTVRASVPSRAVTSADVDELFTMRLGDSRTPADSARVRAGMAEAERMDRFPIMSVIRTDSRGRIWMRPYVWRREDRWVRWVVFEPTGQTLGTVEIPANLQIYDIGPDYLLGSDRDADDAERVVFYPLTMVR